MAQADLEVLAGERAQLAQRIAQIQATEAKAAELVASTAQLRDAWAVERADRWAAVEAAEALADAEAAEANSLV